MSSVRGFVEAEAGSSVRRAYDETTFELLGSRQLAAAYPFPYGFVTETMTGDGGAVDCYLLTATPVSAGRLVEATPVGLLEQFEDGVPDHKLLAVPSGDPRTVDPDVRQTLERFIRTVFRRHPNVKVEVGRLLGADTAREYVAAQRIPGAREGAQTPPPADP